MTLNIRLRNLMLTIYHKLFNIILNTGKVPDSCTMGIIQPIFKNKGNIYDPSSYRPITLVSCLGKTFTSILNERLGELSTEVNLISEAQTGFRKGYSTLDNIFVLHSLILIYQALGKKLFCTFVDFSRAFDTISHTSLWIKLQKANISGKMFKVIYRMYSDVKSCVRNGNEVSAVFNCNIGVRQGENVGKITCYDVSVVDYLILSSDLFRMTKNFKVEEFNHILSDVHCNLKFTLESKPYENR